MLRVGAHVFLDLHHEFARRRDHQRAHPAPLSVADGSGELRQDRQNERGRLARARLRDADEVVSRQNGRDRRRLNRSRLGVASFLDGFENWRRKLQSAKRHKPGTIVPSGASHPVISTRRLVCKRRCVSV